MWRIGSGRNAIREGFEPMIVPPEDRNLSPLETHQHSPSCAPMAASLERIANTLHVIMTVAAIGLGAIVGFGIVGFGLAFWAISR